MQPERSNVTIGPSLDRASVSDDLGLVDELDHTAPREVLSAMTEALAQRGVDSDTLNEAVNATIDGLRPFGDDDPLEAKGVEITLTSLARLARETDAKWARTGCVHHANARKLARLTCAAMATDSSIPEASMVLLRSVREYAVSESEWGEEELVNWPARIMAAFEIARQNHKSGDV